MHEFASQAFLSELKALVPEIEGDRPDPTPAQVAAAKKTLVKGNTAFRKPDQTSYPDIDAARRIELVGDQYPIAAILCCSDSRVPPEIVYWQGLGRVFVIREAGHVLDTHGLGSIHYAIQQLKVPLLVVLGHEHCGAVGAAVKVVAKETQLPAGPLGDLVSAIVPAVEAVWTDHQQAEVVLRKSVEANSRRTANILKRDTIVAAQIAKGALEVLTGYYTLGTGAIRYD